MADAMVEQSQTIRFFCHRCNMEFEDVLQVYSCPFCAGGFIEQLGHDSEGVALSDDEFSDADMSNLDDMSNVDETSNLDESENTNTTQGPSPALNDLAFLMTGDYGGRLRGLGGAESLMEHLVWMIGGGRPGTGAVAAGAQFLLVGAPGDYVFGGEGLDAVVTQLLGQLENSGPPPMSREQIDALPSEPITEAQVAANASCSVCWDNFQIGESVSRLVCDHIFHAKCIAPWLQLHATCPICRRSLVPEGAVSGTSAPVDPADTQNDPGRPQTTTDENIGNISHTTIIADAIPSLLPQLFSQQNQRRQLFVPLTQTWDSIGNTSSSSGSSITSGGIWAPASHSTSNSSGSGSDSTSSLNSGDREPRYNMDIDYD